MNIDFYKNTVFMTGVIGEDVEFTHEPWKIPCATFYLDTYVRKSTRMSEGFPIRCRAYGALAEFFRGKANSEVSVEGELKDVSFSYGTHRWNETYVLVKDGGCGIDKDYIHAVGNEITCIGRVCTYDSVDPGGLARFSLLGRDEYGDSRGTYCRTGKKLTEEECDLLSRPMSLYVTGHLRPLADINWKKEEDKSIVRKCNDFIVITEIIRPLLMKDMEGYDGYLYH